ncbi:MAG: hypothetical protein OES69_00780 [Myxococcales bacterium]|nr:hypothetical protein [Myxococcales bacterium]MDH3842442.1 hypothetical protein [Myxococcales bacterium]
MSIWERRWAIPLAIFATFAVVYCVTSGDRLLSPSPNNHYVHLAQAWLDGRLDVGGSPPGPNDWACFDREERTACPSGRFSITGGDTARYRWYVSFPPLPALLLSPLVAIFGLATWDRLFWALFAGLAPAFLFLVLRLVRESGRSERTVRDDLLVTTLFAVGSVYFFVAVQGSVWFAAHVVATAAICLYLFFSFDARRPASAGLMLGLAFLSRPATLLLAPFFVLEAIRTSRRPGADSFSLTSSVGRFALPVAVLVLFAMWHNIARFYDPFEFGHRFLQIRWRQRIETWGLFDLHYLERNLTVFFASLPWLYTSSPFVRISRHGLALWFTTPNLLWSFWPKRFDATIAALWAAVIPTALCTLLYQNTGWVQFGYRFSLDYLPLVFVLIALCRRRFGVAFLACAVFSIVVNTFGAVTFDRYPQFYDTDPTQEVIFKPK